MTGYDIIGDVHGCADKLTTLLKRLGYAHSDGAYRHPEQRQVVFVGDLIDRGLFQLESVAIPRAMVEQGTAQMVIGNHEFNAVAFATRKADDTDWCRPHNEKNRGQHQIFLDAVEFGSVTHRSILNWLMSLPLWLDLGGVRVVHACWRDDSIEHLRKQVGGDGGLTDQLVRDGTTKGQPSYDAIETVLKGPEIGIGGYWYTDKDGHKRTNGHGRSLGGRPPPRPCATSFGSTRHGRSITPTANVSTNSRRHRLPTSAHRRRRIPTMLRPCCSVTTGSPTTTTGQARQQRHVLTSVL